MTLTDLFTKARREAMENGATPTDVIESMMATIAVVSAVDTSDVAIDGGTRDRLIAMRDQFDGFVSDVIRGNAV